MESRSRIRPLVLIVAEKWDLEDLEPSLEIATQFSVESLVLHQPAESRQASESAADRICTKFLELKPDVLVIGQTETAEEALFRCLSQHPCLVVRWSMFYQNRDFAFRPDHRPEDVGYHVDIPKEAASVVLLLKSSALARAVAAHDLDAVHRELPSTARLLKRDLNPWMRRPGVPIGDLPDSGLRNFVYLDEEGIQDLFDQAGDLHLEEVLIRRSRAGNVSASGKAGLGKFLALLGIGSAELSLGAEGGITLSEEFKKKLSTSDRLRIVLSALANQDALRIVSDHPASVTQVKSSTWVSYTGWFDTRPVLEAIKMNREFVEFVAERVPVVLGTSLRKYKLGLHHVRIQMGMTISRLRIIGELTPVGEGFYLKPFALWQIEARSPHE